MDEVERWKAVSKASACWVPGIHSEAQMEGNAEKHRKARKNAEKEGKDEIQAGARNELTSTPESIAWHKTPGSIQTGFSLITPRIHFLNTTARLPADPAGTQAEADRG